LQPAVQKLSILYVGALSSEMPIPVDIWEKAVAEYLPEKKN
jgi:hypothetical protein